MVKLEEGWLTVVLLCAMMTVAAWGVAAAAWTDGLATTWLTGMVAVFAGLALAKSRFSGRTATLFAAVYGVFCVGFVICLTLSGDWHQRSLELVIRLNNFLYRAIHGGTSRDALPFPVLVHSLFWTFGVFNAWAVFRRGAVWPAIIPAGLGLLINAYYYLGPVQLDLYLAVYVLLALIFMAQMHLLVREREWQSARVAYSPDLRLDFLRAGLTAALVGVVVGWAGPTMAASPAAASAWREMSTSWSVVRESWMRLFASVRGYGQAANDFYGDSLTLGSGPVLDDDPIMDVAVHAPAEDVLDASLFSPVQRYYWGAATFATYADGRWRVGEVEYKEFDPLRTNLIPPPYRERRDVNLTFTMHVAATSRLYVAPQPKWVDRFTTFELTFHPEGVVDVTGVRAQQIVRREESYRVLASVSVADADSLRGAGTRYPRWVTDSFLQLPPEITDRTRALAQQIVVEAGAETPYDQALAIVDWLRRNITYDVYIEAPPPGVEPVDFLLFESRRGFCNYYASAAVMLLRSLGIPARFVAGFAQGALDIQTGVYHVLEKNAHAWPEVFFPDYGWVEFEPTTSEPPLLRPERSEAVGSLTPPPLDRESLDALQALRDRNEAGAGPSPETVEAGLAGAMVERLRAVGSTLVLTGSGLAVAALVAAGLLLRMGMLGWESFGRFGDWLLRSRGLTLPSPVGAVYLRLERAARWLRLTLPEALTPHERAAALGASLPEARPGVEAITAQYVTEQYSPHAADAAAAQAAWRGIRMQVWRQGLRAWLNGAVPNPERAKTSRTLFRRDSPQP